MNLWKHKQKDVHVKNNGNTKNKCKVVLVFSTLF